MNFPKRVPVLAKPHEGISIFSLSSAWNMVSVDLLFTIGLGLLNNLRLTPLLLQRVPPFLATCWRSMYAPMRKHAQKTLRLMASSLRLIWQVERQNSRWWNSLPLRG